MAKKFYNLRNKMNFDEVRAAALMVVDKDIQVLFVPDLINYVDEPQLYNFIKDSFENLDQTKPIFVPIITSSHDTLLTLVPTNEGFQPYFADSKGKLENNQFKESAQKVISAIKVGNPDITFLNTEDLSNDQHLLNNCSLAVVDNISSIYGCYKNNTQVKLRSFQNMLEIGTYFQKFGDEIVETGVLITEPDIAMMVENSLSGDTLLKAESDAAKLQLIERDILIRSGMSFNAIKSLRRSSNDEASKGIAILSQEVLELFKVRDANLFEIIQRQVDRLLDQVGANNEGQVLANTLISKNRNELDRRLLEALKFYGCAQNKSKVEGDLVVDSTHNVQLSKDFMVAVSRELIVHAPRKPKPIREFGYIPYYSDLKAPVLEIPLAVSAALNSDLGREFGAHRLIEVKKRIDKLDAEVTRVSRFGGNTNKLKDSHKAAQVEFIELVDSIHNELVSKKDANGRILIPNLKLVGVILEFRYKSIYSPKNLPINTVSAPITSAQMSEEAQSNKAADNGGWTTVVSRKNARKARSR
jgi:hypothetical protein